MAATISHEPVPRQGMDDQVNPGGRTHRWSKFCFLAVGGLSLLILLSWASGNWRLGTMGEPYVPMAPSTAMALLALAVVAWLWQRRPASSAANWFGRAVALTVLAMGLLVWAQSRFGFDLPSLRPVPTTETVGRIPVGRMSPLTALAFVLASLGLLLQLSAGAGRKALRQAAAILAVLLLLLSTGVTLSYVLQVPLFYSGTVIPMAALTAVGFTLLGLGLLMRTGSDTWPIGLVIHHAPGIPPLRRFAWGLAALALVLTAGTGASGYAYLRHERSEARRVAAETVSAVADLKVRQIGDWYHERRADANTISRAPLRAELKQFLTNPADTETRSEVLAWLQALHHEYGYSVAALVDGQGTVRLSVPSSIAQVDPRVLGECQKALQRRTVIILDLHRLEADPAMHLSLIVPLVSDRPHVVLLLQVDAGRSLFPLVQTWPTPSQTAETLLVRREGNEVVFLNEVRHRQGTARNLRLRIDSMPELPAARAASGEDGVFEGVDSRQVPVVAALRAVPGTPWFLVAKIDKDELYAPFWREVTATIPLLGVLLLAAAAGVSLLWHRRGLLSAERELVLQRQSHELNETLEQRVIERTAQLELSNKELEAFSYAVSHDLRAPLRGIDGWSVALLEDYGDTLDDRAHEYLGRVRSETQRMGSLIDDLLKLSRVARQEMLPKPLDLSTIAEAIAGKLEEREPFRTVEVVIQPGLSAQGDAGLMRVALSNLFENAWKFTSKWTAARIEFGRMDQETGPVFFVRDNGAGFDMDYAQKLFSPFQRLHKTSEFPGTGVGLATVQRIIHRHGGRIWAEAEVGRGATFFFTLEGSQ